VKSAPEAPFDLGHGLGTPDNPIFLGIHEASALVCGGSLLAAKQIADGTADRAVNIAGWTHLLATVLDREVDGNGASRRTGSRTPRG
jgi:acetoin utilization deacetylase AcuC-like enzyme